MLKRTGIKGREVHYIIKSIEDMAAANVIAHFHGELKGLHGELKGLRSELKAQGTKFNLLIALIGALIALGLFGPLLPWWPAS